MYLYITARWLSHSGFVLVEFVPFAFQAQLRLGGGNQGNSDDLEKMELLAALEKCNGRIAALEKQVCIVIIIIIIIIIKTLFQVGNTISTN